MSVLLAVRCGDDAPTSPTTTVVSTTTVVFSGTLGVNDSQFHTFTTAAASTATATLGSLTSLSGAVLSTPVTLALGTVSEDACVDSTSAQARASFVSAVSLSVAAGTYCVRVADPGNLSAPANYAIRVVHP